MCHFKVPWLSKVPWLKQAAVIVFLTGFRIFSIVGLRFPITNLVIKASNSSMLLRTQAWRLLCCLLLVCLTCTSWEKLVLCLLLASKTLHPIINCLILGHHWIVSHILTSSSPLPALNHSQIYLRVRSIGIYVDKLAILSPVRLNKDLDVIRDKRLTLVILARSNDILSLWTLLEFPTLPLPGNIAATSFLVDGPIPLTPCELFLSWLISP